MKNVMIVSFVGLLSACASNGNNIDSAEVAKNKESISDCMAKNPGNEQRCVSQESAERVGLKCKSQNVTGSRLPKRSCTTAAQREHQKKNAKMMVEGMQRRGQTSNSG